jgi:metallo-beta-lactamase family protein
MIEVEVRNQDPPLRILFSGDVGRYDAPLYHDPAPPTACDILVCESTYGNRDHPESNLLDSLADAVNQASQRGGVMLIASFSVGRAQQFIYLLQLLIHEKRVPRIPVFLDSPMAVNATHIYYDHREDHDLSEGQLSGRHSVLKGPNVHLSSTTEQSKRLNHVKGPAVIISSAGMMTGGRILHHLKNRLPDPKNTILLGGYMAEGTRGRSIQEGRKTIRIHGQDIDNRAAVAQVSGLSGHAGKSELLRWLKPLPDPRQVFLTHGEKESAESFAETLRQNRGWEVQVPRLGQVVEL